MAGTERPPSAASPSPATANTQGPTREAAATATGTPPRNPWVITGAVLLGTYLIVVNTTVLGVALPHIDADLGATSPIDVDWVVTTYLLAVVLVQPATGWLSDRFGRRAVYLTALVSFGVGSVGAVLAPTLPLLLAARVLQGLGGGAIMPVGMAIVYSLFPPDRRGQALGMWGMAVMAAPALGPPLGGWAVSAASWRWLFAAMIVLAAVALVASVRLLPASECSDPRPLDLTSWVLAALAMPGIVVLTRQAQEWGFTSPATLLLGLAVVGLVVTLVLRSLRVAHPLIEFRVFTVGTFALTSTVLPLVTMTQFAVINYLPVELQVVRGLDPSVVGLLIVPNAVATMITMPLAGRLADRLGSRWLASGGHLLGATSLAGLALLNPDTPIEVVVGLMALMGAGNGIGLMPTTLAGMNSLPERLTSQASALLSLNRQLAGAIGVAAFAAVLVATLGSITPRDLDTAADIAHAQAGYNTVFAVAAAMRLTASAVALGLPGRRRMAEFQRARTAETNGEAPGVSEP